MLGNYQWELPLLKHTQTHKKVQQQGSKKHSAYLIAFFDGHTIQKY